MLTIREEQMRVFELAKSSLFMPEMIQYLATNFPVHTTMLGEDGLTKLIKDGISKAGKFGFETSYQATLFIELMIQLGCDFSTDPQLKWTRRIMDNENADPDDTIDLLYATSNEYLEKIHDHKRQFPLSAYQKFIDTSFESLSSIHKEESNGPMNEFLMGLWPEKFQSIPPTGLNELFDTYLNQADKHGFTSLTTTNLYLILMFLLGHHFDTDQSYPWIVDLMNDEQYDEEVYKASSLHFTVQRMLEAIIETINTKSNDN